jgi:hypothetical protein
MATKSALGAEQTTKMDNDLESVITTSFLNLERLDVDLYR